MQNKDKLFKIIDLLCYEYKWTLDYVLSLNRDVLINLYNTRLENKKQELKLKTKLQAFAIAAGMSGKINKLDSIFGFEKVEDDEMIEQLRGLWIKMGKDPKELEEKLAKGEHIVF